MLSNTEEEGVNAIDLKQRLVKGNYLLEELKEYVKSEIGAMVENEINLEYQRVFKVATTTEDANMAKACLDRMKGLGFALNVNNMIILNLEDDLSNLREEIEIQEEGKQ